MSNNNKNGAKPAPKKQQQKQKPQNPRRRRGNGQGLQFAPAAQSRPMQSGNPSYSAFSKSDASILVRHRELFSDLSGSTSSFSISAPAGQLPFPIQPAREKVFPWLASLAQLYESYDFERLQFDYVPRCSTSTSGFVAMGVDYDCKDAQPANKVSLMAYHGSVASAPWQPCSLICDRRDLHKMGRQLYCRSFTASTQGSTDRKTYDVGNLWVAVGGQASAAMVGELYVTYTIRLSTPQLNTAQIAKAKSKIITPTAGVSKTYPLGSAAAEAGGLPISRYAATSSGSSAVWIDQAGTYLADLIATGTGLATGAVKFVPQDAANIASTPVDIANAAGTVESVTQLFNVVQPGFFNIDASAATTLTSLIPRFAVYAPSSTQVAGSALNETLVDGED